MTPQGTRPGKPPVDGEIVTLQAPHIGRFSVRPAEITVHPLPDLDLQLLGQALVGAPLAVWLHQRGRHLIHGSALSVDGRAIGIVGPSGTGKSTLSATLWRRGHALVTDDLMALDMALRPRPYVFPGSPYLKLWPASLAAMDARCREPAPTVSRRGQAATRCDRGDGQRSAATCRDLHPVLGRGAIDSELWAPTRLLRLYWPIPLSPGCSPARRMKPISVTSSRRPRSQNACP